MVGISNFQHPKQEFHAETVFTNEPGRCPECRAAQNQGSSGYGRQEREMFPAVCATCGRDKTVPFQPSGEKPVYCRECFVPPTRNKW